MPGLYRPDENALQIPPWTTVHLSNRDLASRIPINFVTHPGISLTSACFAHGVFENSQAATCISNLLAAQFQRFIIDLYWDADSRQFTFCPASIKPGFGSPNSTSTLPTSRTLNSEGVSTIFSGSTRTTISDLRASQPRASNTASSGLANDVRHAFPATAVNASNVSSSPPDSSTGTGISLPSSTSPSGTILYEVGPYQCSATLDLKLLASLLFEYIEKTSDTLSANLLFLQFNLHAATRVSAPAEPAPTPSGIDLPSHTELAGTVFDSMVSPFVYQPPELRTERESLNSSWYNVPASEQPITGYFITENQDNEQSTPDGWPSEHFTELTRLNRLLLSWGSIDPQMEGYDFAGDSRILFPPNYISSYIDVGKEKSEQIGSGCFYNAEQTTVAQSNSSWAISVLNATSSSPGSSDRLWSLSNNLPSCGITPVLNVTLANQTVDVNVSSYTEFVRSTVWNWASGEPRISPDIKGSIRDNDQTQGPFRCALMETFNTSTSNRWRVEYCNMHHRAACRMTDQPFLWRLSDDSVVFSAAEFACPENFSFSVPRTGLENRYLSHQVQSLSTPFRAVSGNDSGIWLNFNSIDVEDCWVTTGSNGSCPYSEDQDALRQRTVLVPVIAALVVLILTALTLFVKCNTNRRNSRKRVRGAGGWDYEGVPS